MLLLRIIAEIVQCLQLENTHRKEKEKKKKKKKIENRKYADDPVLLTQVLMRQQSTGEVSQGRCHWRAWKPGRKIRLFIPPTISLL